METFSREVKGKQAICIHFRCSNEQNLKTQKTTNLVMLCDFKNVFVKNIKFSSRALRVNAYQGEIAKNCQELPGLDY